jgi:hypothetical protein
VRKLLHKAILGALLAVGSFVCIDYVSGGLFAGSSGVTNAQVSVFMCESDSTTDGRMAFRAKFSLRSMNALKLGFSAFDQVLDRARRKALIDGCHSIVLRMNFLPTSIVAPASNKDLKPLLEKNCRPQEYCLKLDRTLVQESRGHIDIDTGLGISRTSLSSAAVKLGVVAGQPATDIETTVDLPDGWLPSSPLPEPTHVSNFAWTRLTWKSDDAQGVSSPQGANRAIEPSIGILLPILNSRLKTVETTLLFFLSAIFGVGFTLLAEWSVAIALGGHATTRPTAAPVSKETEVATE